MSRIASSNKTYGRVDQDSSLYLNPETKRTMRLTAYQRSKRWEGKPGGAWHQANNTAPTCLICY